MATEDKTQAKRHKWKYGYNVKYTIKVIAYSPQTLCSIKHYN